MIRDNQPIELTEHESFMARASFIHLVYGNCCGVLIFKGEFPSHIAEDVTELIFGCKKCGEKVVLID